MRQLGQKPSMSGSDIDNVMVRKAQRGDNAAFDYLVNKYQQRTFVVVAQYVGNPTEAHDIVQDVFLKVFTNLKNFRSESTFSTWLHRITVNTVKTYFAKKARDKNLAEVEEFVMERNLELARGRDYTAPLEVVVRHELVMAVSAAVKKLPEKLRTTIMLHEADGLTYAEIAKVMDCPIGTVRSRISRAKAIIVRMLSSKLDDFR